MCCMIEGSILFQKDQMVKIKKINKVYGGPSKMLVHPRRFGLKLTERDQIG